MGRPRLLLVLATFCAATFAFSSTAWATNYVLATGQTSCTALNRADNKVHTFSYEALRSDVQAAVGWARLYVYDPTVVNTSYVSQTAATDAIIRTRTMRPFVAFLGIQRLQELGD